jgi:T5SS/PEP-CTERM-associated repeat protein
MPGSTWTWLGGTINVDSASDWTLTPGLGNGTGFPQTGDTANNSGTLVGYGLIAAALVNSGTIVASDNSVPGSSTGGKLEIQGAVSGTGSMTIAPGATLQIDGALGTGQNIAFGAGGSETLILGSPTGTISNPITGFSLGDKIEFSNGITVTYASVLNGNTLAVTYHNAVGSIGVYDLTNVTFAANTPTTYTYGYDPITNDQLAMPTHLFTWIGGSGTNFSTAANWNFGTIAPSAFDFVSFNNGIGGTISGTGATAVLNFYNTGTWSLATGTTLSAARFLNVGRGGGGIYAAGALTIGSGSTITSSGGEVNIGTSAGNVATLTVSGGGVLQETAATYPTQYAMYVGSSPASGALAAGSGSVIVTGTGSLIDLGFNGLDLGSTGGSGSLTVSQGGSVIAATTNSNVNTSLAIGRLGNGTLTVMDPGSQVTAVGIAYVAHSATGSLVVENFGTFLAALDPLGLAGLIIGDGSTTGVGGTGAATVTTDGVLDSRGYVIVGLRGTEGQLTVLNGGTVQVGTTLTVGTGGTISNGATETGNGILTIGAGGTVELTGTAQTSVYGVYLGNSNIGTASTENAVATVSGTGAVLNTNGNGLAVAQYGTATLTVSQGGSVASGTPDSNLIAALAIGRQGSGTVTVTDINSGITANGNAYVGRAGTGSLIVENQGSVVIGLDGLGAGGLSIGGGGTNSGSILYVGGTGTALITSGGDLFSQANIDVGRNGATGTLTVQSGGTAEAAGQLLIGNSITLAPGVTLISPTGTTAVTSTTVEAGTGTVTVGVGGLLRVDGTGVSGAADITVGAGAGSTGILNVTGAAALLTNNNGTITIGGAGSGTLDVSNGGSVQVGSLSNGTSGTILLGGGTISASGPSSSTGEVSGFGIFSGPLTNSGTVIASGGTLEMTGSVTGSGVLQIANNAILRLDAAPATGQSVSFGTGTGTGAELILNAPGTAFSDAITGLGTGDTIEFGNGMAVTSASVVNGNTIAVTYYNSVGSIGVYDLTNVGFAAGSGQQLSVGFDISTRDSFIQIPGGAASTTTWTVINSIEELQNIKNNPGGNYILGSDIDASATTTWNGGAGFLPIDFYGVFDGNGHNITGLTINTTGNEAGLFGQNTGIIRNIGVVDANITGNLFVGAVSATNDGTITNVYVTGSVVGVDAGGIVGWNTGGLVNLSYANTTVAYANATTVTGLGELGGLVGSNTSRINQSFSEGKVVGATGIFAAGGLVGGNQIGSVSNVGTVEGSILQSFASGSVSGPGRLGGLVGNSDSGIIAGSYWDTQTSGLLFSSGGTGLTTAQLTSGTLPAGFDSSVWSAVPGLFPSLTTSFFSTITTSFISTITTSPATGVLDTGQVVTFTLGLNEAVTVAGGVPTLRLNDGGAASYTGGSGTSTLTFSYTVAAGQNTADLLVTGLALNGATIGGTTFDSTSVASAPGHDTGLVVHTTAPPPSTGPARIALRSGGAWSTDSSGNETYTGTVVIGYGSGEDLLRVVGGTATFNTSTGDLAFSSGATAYALVGGLSAPLITGAFDINVNTGQSGPLSASENFLAGLPLTVTQLQLGQNRIALGYDLSLVGSFLSVSLSAPLTTLPLLLSDSGISLGTPGYVAIPDIPSLDFFGLFTATLSHAELSSPLNGSEVRVSGTLTMASPFGGSAASLTLGLNSPNSYIAITDTGGTPSVSLVGQPDVKANISLATGWGLDGVSVEFDPNAHTITGSATLDLPFFARGLEATLGFATNPWALNAIDVNIPVPGIGIPIVGTQLYLTSVEGAVDNIAATATAPIDLSGALGFSVGPNNEPVEAASFVASGTITYGQSFTAGVTGDFGEFNDPTLGQFNLGTFSGSATLDWATKAFDANAELNLLGGLFDGQVDFSANQTGVRLVGTGSLQIPHSVSLFGHTYDVPWWLDPGQTIASGGIEASYTFNAPPSSDFVVIWANVGFGLTAGIQINFDGTHAAIKPNFFGLNGLPSLPALSSAAVLVSQASVAQATFASVAPGASDTFSSAYAVGTGVSLLILDACWSASSGTPDLAVIEPDGTVIQQADFVTAGFQDVPSFDSATSRAIAITTPATGNWQLGVDTAVVTGPVTFSAYTGLSGAILSVDAPVAGAGNSWDYNWTATNLPADATVTFYADSVGSGFGGVPISAPMTAASSGQFVWDGSGVAPGSYYVYGVLAGDGAVPVDAYAAGTAITVNNAANLTAGLSGPSGVIANRGQSITLDVTATNTGPSTAKGVYAALSLPSGFIVAPGQTLVSQAGGSPSVQLGDIAPGGTVDVPVIVTESGTVTTALATFHVSAGSATFNSGTIDSAAFSIGIAATRTLAWTGVTDRNFGTAGNWNDATDALNPATTPPGAGDIAEFLDNGGTITGAGTAATLQFGGTAAWTLTAGATLSAAAGISVDEAGSGALTLIGGGNIIGQGTLDVIASAPGSSAMVTVAGVGSLWSSAGELDVGDAGLGSLLVSSSGTVTTTSGATIANAVGSDGSSAEVIGAGSALQVTGSLVVGQGAAGSLSVYSAGTVTAASADLGAGVGSSGAAVVGGLGSQMTLTGSLIVGDSGIGNLSILNGANVNIGGNFNIGQGIGGSGNVDIEDATGTVFVGGNLNIGVNGAPSVLTVGPTSTLMVDNGGINAGANAVLNLYTSIDPQYLSGGTSNVSSSTTNAITQIYTAYVANATFNIGEGSFGLTYTLETPVVEGTTKFSIGGSADTLVTELILNAGSVSSGSSVTFNNAIDTLVIGFDNLGTILTPPSGTTGFTAVANPNLNVPLIGGFQGTINNFVAGDTIVVDTDGAATFSQNGSVVSVIENGSTLGVLTFSSVTAAQTAANTPGALVDNALCFLAGTLIRTPSGETPVERLAIGDSLLTASGQSRPVTWIGVGRVLATRGRRNAATPVIVRKGALGPNVPHQDLHVTKGHSLFIDDVLIPVEFLVNHRSILWDDRAQEVSIYHVELESHDVLIANGAPAESYRDDGNRWLFQNANSGWGQGPKPACAPVLTGGPVVDTAWRRLLDRCGPRPGVPMTDDPDVHLMVDGARMDATSRHGEAFIFSLSARPDAVRIISRAGAPAELGLARDPRVLGVALRRIAVRQGTRFGITQSEDASLTEGFHAFEPDNGLRWTDGDAVLPRALFEEFDGPMELVLHVGSTTQYLLSGEAPQEVAA